MKNQRALSQQLHKQSGLTLLEIMITVVILSLGLLGLAGLQMTGLKNNRNAYYQTVAAQAVQDIGERLRVDEATLDAITATRYVDANANSCAAVNPTFNLRVACLVSALPGGRARLTTIDDDPKTMLVAVRWTDLQLNGEFGWGTGTTTTNPGKPDSSACGTLVQAARNMSCYYTVFRP